MSSQQNAQSYPRRPDGLPRSAGRPRGARNRFCREFIEALQKDFQEHGADAIKVVRIEDPGTYLRVCASLMPRELTVETVAADLGDDELDNIIERLRTELLIEHKVQPAILELKESEYSSNVD